MSLTAPLALHAGRTPDRVALAFEGDRITWRELDRAVARLAAHIRARVPEGRGVALDLPNGPALALLFLAACRAGREAQILDPDWPAQTRREVLAALSPGMLVSANESPGGDAIVLDPDLPFRDVAATLAGPMADASTREMDVEEPDPSRPFYVGFTSGSTGLPKGYRRNHRSWLESFRAGDAEFGIGADDVVLAPGTLTHSLFLYGLAHGLHVGAKVILCRRFRPTIVTRLIAEHRVSVLYGVPTQLDGAIDAAERGSEGPFGNVRWVLSSGAKWPTGATPRLRRLFPAARFAEFYGASELSFVTVAKDGEDVPAGSVGRAFDGVVLTVRDREGRPLPPGRAGLVFVESPFVFAGYACGDAAGLLRAGSAVSVGDIGVLDDRGFLRLVGREGRMIVTSGKNIQPEEVERILQAHPAIAAAAVLGVPDAKRGERLVALVRLRPGVATTRSALIAEARSALPLYKVPRLYGIAADWPMTRSGKTDFHALGRMWAAGQYGALA